MKPAAYIFDMDGTLANVDSILHYIKGDRTNPNFRKNFAKFHEESVNVPPREEVVDMLWDSRQRGFHTLIVSARKEMWRPHTSMWLALNLIPSDALFMRQNNDNRPDFEVKAEILEYIKQLWDVVHAVDDNPNVIRLWQENGIPTTKIGDWDGTY